MNVQRPGVIPPTQFAARQPVRFGERYNNVSIGGVGWNREASGVTNWENQGKVIPLMVSLRPNQADLLEQIAQNTQGLTESINGLAEAIRNRMGLL